VVVVIFVAAGVAGYYAYSSGLLVHKNTSTTSSAYYHSLALASPSQVNSTLGGGWNQVANMTFATSSMSEFLEEYQSSSGSAGIFSMNSHYSTSSSSSIINETLGTMESFQVADYYSQTQGIMVMGYAHFLFNNSASTIYTIMSADAMQNTSVKTGNLNGNPFFYISNNSSLYSGGPNIFKYLLVSNYGGEIIAILTVTNTSISLTNVENLLSDEYSILHTYGPVTSSVTNVISQSTLENDLGITTNLSTNASLYVNHAFINAEDNFLLSIDSNSSSTTQLGMNGETNLALNLTQNLTSLQVAVYNNQSLNENITGIALASFESPQFVTEIYDNLSESIAESTNSAGSNLTLNNGTFSSGGKYIVLDSSSMINGKVQIVSIALAYHGNYLFTIVYAGFNHVTSSDMVNALNAEVSLL
jgi:hypothetical protein